MFRMVSVIGFIVTFAGIALHCIASQPKLDDLLNKARRLRFQDGLRVPVYLLTLLLVEQRLSLLGVLKKLVYLLALLCFVVLAITGFYPTLVLGKHISGYWLMLHATFVPVFAVCLAILAVMWASRHRFTGSDWPWLQRILPRIVRLKATSKETLNEGSELGQKITFWLIVVLALPLILSMVSSMFPLFGTEWQKLLLELHRYSALLFALVAIVHIYLIILTQAMGITAKRTSLAYFVWDLILRFLAEWNLQRSERRKS